jgi:hypothetical protein
MVALAGTATSGLAASARTSTSVPQQTTPRVDDHGPLGSAGPFHQPGGAAGALAPSRSPCLRIIVARLAGAHSLGGGVNDAAVLVLTREIRWTSADQIPLGQ